MSRSALILAIATLALCMRPAMSQPAAGLTDGTTFAKGIAPATPGQIVNPSAVNSSAWTGTSVPTSTPQNLGTFSSPQTGSSTYTSAQTMGLSGLGQQTQSQCANYVPGTDPLKDQQCAAVNFMSNNCLPLSATQQKVVGTTPIPTGAGAGCAGTYGQGASQYNYNQMTATDGIFSNVNAAQTNASSSQSSTCTNQTVITNPAQNASATCVKSLPTTQWNCSQTMSCTVQFVCNSGGTLGGITCTTTSTRAAGTYYYCPAGWTLSGTTCSYSYAATFTTEWWGGIISWGAYAWGGFVILVDESGNGNNSSYAAMLTCPSGGTLGSVPSPLPWYGVGNMSGNITYYPSGTPVSTINPVSATCTMTQAASLAYNCPSGGSLSGASCVTTSTYSAATTSNCTWADSCTAYETSAGATLPIP